MNNAIDDPFLVLGLNHDADQASIRQAYLDLVKQFPPDKDADKFHEIHQAYQWLCDPVERSLSVLKEVLKPMELDAAIAKAAAVPPRLATRNLLALGNVDKDQQ